MSTVTENINAAADNADDAAIALTRVNGAAGMAGQQAVVDKFTVVAQARALVSIAQSLVVLATQSAIQMGSTAGPDITEEEPE